MHIYEYLFTAIIIVTMLVASSIIITSLSSPTIDASNQNQLKLTAEKIMNQILLDPGQPYNWGSELTQPQDLTAFGLSKHAETARGAYILDPDKVMRLHPQTNSFYINPTYAAQNLKLTSSDMLEYGFRLEFQTPFTIEVHQESSNSYSLNITSEYNLPLSNAQVYATLYYLHDNTINYATTKTQVNPDGTTTLDFSTSTSNSKVLITTVDFYGVHATKINTFGTSHSTPLIANSIIHNSIPLSSESNKTQEILLIKNDNVYSTRSFQNDIQTIESSIAVLETKPEPSSIAILTIANQDLVVAHREFSAITYSTTSLDHYPPFAYSTERTVHIGCSTYKATLTLWRMSF